MNRSVLIAVLFIVALVGWIASGVLRRDDKVAPVASPRSPSEILVEVRPLEARPVMRSLLVQGEVRPNRDVALRAQSDGNVTEVLVEEGQRVEAGTLVVRLALDELAARREEVQAQVAQREADYEAASRLGERGFTPEQRVRETFAQLKAARAALARIEKEIEDTTIEAPFSGIVNDLAVEVGEFVKANGEVATLIDNDPLIVSVNVPQQSIGQVSVGAPASVAFVTGREADGRITFVSANAQRETRTFRVDIQVPNPDAQTPSGISAEVRIPVEMVSAHFLSPALLSLGPDGALGVKTVDENSTVRFYPVSIVRAQADGIWVSGLPAEIRLITTGQGFVRPGERVAVAEAQPRSPPPRDSGADAPPQDPAGRGPVSMSPTADGQAQAVAQELASAAVAAASPPAAMADRRLPGAEEPVSIEEVQRALNAAGFEPGPADGIAGPQTVEAIRAAQERFGLPATGEPTAELLRRLLAIAETPQ